MGIFYNKNASKIRNNLFSPPDRHPMEFHHHLQGYQPTPLVDAQELAATLHVGRIWIKDESDRLGLPSFKILGTSWAIYRALIQRFGNGFERWNTLEGFAEQLKPLRPITLAAATDGNHGRAVARIAALLKFDAHIFVPIGTAEARIKAIESEGATVTIVNGTYDDAIATASREESERCLVISDVSWAGYEDIPKWIIEGYSTIFLEVDDELAIR